MRVDVVSCKFV